jgi:PKD repeat protein
MRFGMKRILASLLIALACSKAIPPVHDAGVDKPAFDAAPSASDTAVSLTVDFSVENCPAFDAQAMTCTGPAPLSVRFAPLATTTVTQYFWDFGDATPFDGELAPNHVYATPGVYTVRLLATGVGGGVVTKVHTDLMVVQANLIGDPCDANQQCDQGLFCLCPANAPCSTGPTHGLCAASCESGICGDTGVCAGLRTATPPSGKASDWQGSMCLRACAKDVDCSAGLSCRTLPPGKLGSAWIHGCFASVPGDVGDPCRDDEGNLRNDLCASGLCTDLGANGMCSASCEWASCPPGSDCAVFGDGRKLCLRPCTGDFTCSKDSLLTCVVPGPGDLGYQLASPIAPSTASSYCAPKPCNNDIDCNSPTGSCVSVTGPGHCVLRSN